MCSKYQFSILEFKLWTVRARLYRSRFLQSKISFQHFSRYTKCRISLYGWMFRKFQIFALQYSSIQKTILQAFIEFWICRISQRVTFSKCKSLWNFQNTVFSFFSKHCHRLFFSDNYAEFRRNCSKIIWIPETCRASVHFTKTLAAKKTKPRPSKKQAACLFQQMLQLVEN